MPSVGLEGVQPASLADALLGSAPPRPVYKLPAPIWVTEVSDYGDNRTTTTHLHKVQESAAVLRQSRACTLAT